jgi:hypothetical protein
MFTTHTGRRYRLPSSSSIRRARLRASIRRACGSVAFAALLMSPMFFDAFLRP